MEDSLMQSSLVRTALPPSVRLDVGSGNLPRLRVSNPHGQAEIYLHGAHVSAWQPTGQPPVIWLSRESAFAEGKPIRGGVPICFPWFATHATEKTAPGHGYARLEDWPLVDARDDANGTTLTFELASADRAWPLWPHPFRALYRVILGPSLGLSLEVHNTGAESVLFEEALHTYFAVQYVREISITGLEGVDYLDKVDNMARKNQGVEPIRFTGETDRIYLDTKATVTIHDPGRRRRIVIAKTGSDATVVWNPWIEKAKAMPDFGDLEWPEMVCVETCNVNAHAVKLAAGARHTMTASIRVEGA
jgi:D-hexose-6-phosphate mutarotase